MISTVLQIDGMYCSMCESHVNDAVRKSFQVKKVSSNHKKGRTEILSDSEISREELENALRDTGYRIISYESKPYEKKRLFGRK